MSNESAPAEIAAWRSIASTPSAVRLPPVFITGPARTRSGVTARVSLTRDHAAEFFAAEVFSGRDVLILSSSLWDTKASRRVAADRGVTLDFAARFLSAAAAAELFDYPLALDPQVHYGLILVDAEQRPVRPSADQAEALERSRRGSAASLVAH